MLECPDCHESFKNSRSLYNHKSREKKKKRNGLPTCAIRKQYIEENQIVRETIENTSKHEIFQAINTTIRDANKASRMNELLKENAELKDQLQNKSEEYLKGLANDEIRKLKSHIQGLEKRIQELESYIEERKDVTSKAEDSRRLWRREFAIASAKCSEDTDKNLFNSLSFSLQQIQSMSNNVTRSRILWRGSTSISSIHFGGSNTMQFSGPFSTTSILPNIIYPADHGFWFSMV